MKKMYLLVTAILLSSVAMAVTPGNGEGTPAGGSRIDLDILANVADRVAVNQEQPIDFGNLLRGKVGTITQQTMGRITVEKSTAVESLVISFDRVSDINLGWISDNGSLNPALPGGAPHNQNITGVQLNNSLIEVTGTAGVINVPETAEILLAFDIGAQFTAVALATGNLGANQKLGRYEGKVRITAELGA